MKKILIAAIVMFFFITLSSNAEAQVCCEKTNAGDFCQFTDASNCDANFKSAQVSCEQTSFCQVGCCVDTDDGQCFSSAARAECENKGASWVTSQNCEIPICAKGCCLIGGEAFFTTEVACRAETSNFPNVNMTFREDITSELQCINLGKSQDEGCCVTENSCSFGTGAECAEQEVIEFGNETGKGFFKGVLCSNPILNCKDCAKQQTTSCVPGKDGVYWFDSCGNRENIYSSDREASYNEGFVLTQEESCNLNGAFDPNCGNCNYAQGTLCGSVIEGEEENKKFTEPAFGDFICRSTACIDVPVNEFSPGSGGNKQNGESWCVFDGPVGQGRDVVGSRHYRTLCFNGEVFVEPCKDFREEICIQGVAGENPASSVFDALTLGGVRRSSLSDDFIEARCRDNRFNSCFDCNNEDDVQKCCENVQFRDCSFVRSGVTGNDNEGVCVPEVPPGLNFFTDQATSTGAIRATTPTGSAVANRITGRQTATTTPTTPTPSTTTTSTPTTTRTSPTQAVPQVARGSVTTGTTSFATARGEDQCEKANSKCDVLLVRGGVTRGLGGFGSFLGNFFPGASVGGESETESRTGGVELSNDWRVIVGEECLTRDYLIAGNNLCRSMGDCGAYLNIAGEKTLDGYKNTLTAVTAESDIFEDRIADLKANEVEDLRAFTSAKNLEDTRGFFSKYGSTLVGGGLILAQATFNRIIVGEGGFILTAGPRAVFRGFFPKEGISKTTAYWENLGKRIEKESIGGWSAPIDKTNVNKLITNQKDQYLQEAIKDKQQRLISENLKNLKPGTDKTLLSGEDALKQAKEYYKNPGEVEAIATEAKRDVFAKEGIIQEGDKFYKKTPYPNYMTYINTYLWAYTVYSLINQVFSEEEKRTIEIGCQLWQPPVGGENCELCNDDPLGRDCSLYRCKSLGQLCSLINTGTQEERCVNVNPNDANSPLIEPDKNVIRPEGITEVTAEGNKGFKLNKAISPLGEVTLGIKTNEPAQCRFDSRAGINFDNMQSFFGSNFFKNNHRMNFNLPDEFFERDAIRATSGGQFQIFVKCQDASGNRNNRDYFIKFQLTNPPDLTAPVVERTSLQSGAFVKAGQNETDFSIFVNERAECRWETRDTDFEFMSNQFTCLQNSVSNGALFQGLFECRTKLTGIKDSLSRDFFIRCKDKPGSPENERKVNQESFMFTMRGSKELKITASGPSGDVFNDTVTLKVLTSEGTENGASVCAFSQGNNIASNQIMFLETNSSKHEQPLVLDFGDQSFDVTCRDKAGNEAKTKIEFSIKVDKFPPRVVKIFADLLSVHFELDEKATCEFSPNSTFKFGRGIKLNENSKLHDFLLDTGALIHNVICEDNFENELNFDVRL